MKSISPVSGNEYSFDSSHNDPGLEIFIEKNKNKKIVVVQGLGFVGTVMSLVVANSENDEYAVIGVDLKTKNTFWKISDLNSGHLPISSSDPLVEEYYKNSIEKCLKLYDEFFKIGDEFKVKPGCPHLIERIESGLLSYGNDIDLNDNPFECGFDKFVNVDSDINFLGKKKLIKIKSEGVRKKLMGVKLDLKKINITESIDIMDENSNPIGELRSGCYSPYFDQVIGIAMLNKPNWNANQPIKIKINDQAFDGKVCDLPFI